MSTTTPGDTMRGRMAPGDARSNPVHETGRVCEEQGCATVLSIYNATGWCWQHEQPHAYVLQAPRKRRKDARTPSPGPTGPTRSEESRMAFVADSNDPRRSEMEVPRPPAPRGVGGPDPCPAPRPPAPPTPPPPPEPTPEPSPVPVPPTIDVPAG